MQAIFLMPSADTLRYMKATIQASPVTFEPDQWALPIFFAEEINPEDVDPQMVFTARAGTLRQPYNPALQTSQLVLPLESPAIQNYVSLLHDEYNPTQPFEYEQPNLVILERLPPLSRTYRSFFSSISTTWATSNRDIDFTAAHIRVLR